MTKTEILDTLRSELEFLKSKNFSERKIWMKEKIINQIERKFENPDLFDLLDDYLEENEPYAVEVGNDYIMFPVWIRRNNSIDLETKKHR